MGVMHVTEVLHSDTDTQTDIHLEFALCVGAGSVDPRLVEPTDGQEHQDVEELVAFRCSSL